MLKPIMTTGLLALLASPFAMAADQVGEVIRADGVITVEREGPAGELRLGAPVYEYDVIYTGDDANLAIRLADRTELLIGANSMIYMKEYLINATAKGQPRRMNTAFSPGR